MKLDFNFDIVSWVDNGVAQANTALLVVLQSADVKNEIYLDKIEIWVNSMKKNGTIEVDAPDAEFLKGLIIAADINAMGKIPLKNYIKEQLNGTATTV